MRRVLTVAGAGALMLFSMALVLADQASANDGPLCAPTKGFVPKLCVGVPLAVSVRREDPAPVQTVVTMPHVAAWQPDVAPRTDVALEAGTPAIDVPPAVVTFAAALVPSEPERAVGEARSTQHVFDINDLRSYAWGAAVRQGIDPVIFSRQIAAESDFNPHAISRAGAVGIAQIMPTMHPGVDPTDPYASLDYAARLMRGYINHYGDWRRALIAYNAGPGRLEPGNRYYLPQSTILSNAFAGGETMHYVQRILGR